MRLSQGFWQTLKEIPNDAEIPSHQLMMRAGLIHKTAGGLYTYLPMAFRSLQKIKKIIREEHDRIGCFEVQMSVITPAELWKETGRWDVMGPQMLRIKDRAERELCVSPTNEETVTDVFRKTINSYKQLPVCLYQINTKFRDEIRPRFGLLRGREFTMKDGYSLHMDKACLDTFYEKIYGAYNAIFKRMGLDFISVEADGGAMASGGAKTHEFQLIADNGEDTLVTVPATGYAANIEKAPTTRANLKPQAASDLTKISTPNQKTCEEVAAAHGFDITHTLKSLIMHVLRGEKEHFYMVMLLGDDQLNEVKFKNAMNADHVRPAQANELEKLGLIKGFMGPTAQAEKLSVLYDLTVDLNSSYVVGANEAEHHMKGFVPSRDTKLTFKQLDLRLAKEGDVMNGQPIVLKKGIEVGHVFQLGDKYTKSMGATVLNAQGKAITPQMGCYGIGVTRTLAAAIEQNHDKDGIIWPAAIAPYDVYFGMIAKADETKAIAEEIYKSFLDAGLEVLFDDRGMGPGGMFKDADLIGLPVRVILGERDFQATGEIEIKVRKTGETLKVKREALIATIKEKLQSLGKYA
ncbi:MAG: proline--tRNA ligase [Bacteriovoracaceae bacterium]|nr:proline--tRNA ligase [Bacteriovoracaceae bacterium]